MRQPWCSSQEDLGPVKPQSETNLTDAMNSGPDKSFVYGTPHHPCYPRVRSLGWETSCSSAGFPNGSYVACYNGPGPSNFSKCFPSSTEQAKHRSLSIGIQRARSMSISAIATAVPLAITNINAGHSKQKTVGEISISVRLKIPPSQSEHTHMCSERASTLTIVGSFRRLP